MQVHVIEAKPRQSSIPVSSPEHGKKRVCAYARISHDDGDDTSLPNQIAHYENLIKSNDQYVFTQVYFDDGVSGTSLKNRDGFNKMMEDVEAGKIDLILTKSISRYSRNVVNTLNSIRRCRELGVEIRFEKEGLSSMDPAADLLLTIMSSLSEQESASISANIKLGLSYLYSRGVDLVNCNNVLGYTRDPETREILVDPEQAETVRFIYRSFLEGSALGEIAAHLRSSNTPSATGKTRWPLTTIRYILSNERYTGNVLLQKSYCPSFLTHESRINDGAVPQYFVENAHTPIIPSDVYNLVQSLLPSRGWTTDNSNPGARKGALSGRVYCSCCNRFYQRYALGPVRGVTWKCRGKSKAYNKEVSVVGTVPLVGFEGGDWSNSVEGNKATIAHSRNVKEEELQWAVVKAFNELSCERGNVEEILRAAEEFIDSSGGGTSVVNSVGHRIDEQAGGAQSVDNTSEHQFDVEHTGGGGGSDENSIDANSSIDTTPLSPLTSAQLLVFHCKALLELIDALEGHPVDRVVDDQNFIVVKDLTAFMAVTRPEIGNGIITSFDDELVARYVEKIVVNKDGFEVRFKAGINIAV